MHVEVFRFGAKDLSNVLQAIHGYPRLWYTRTKRLGGSTPIKEICLDTETRDSTLTMHSIAIVWWHLPRSGVL